MLNLLNEAGNSKIEIRTPRVIDDQPNGWNRVDQIVI